MRSERGRGPGRTGRVRARLVALAAVIASVAPVVATGPGPVAAAVATGPAVVSPYILLDQFGYLPAMRKVAVLADPQVGSNASDAYSPGTGAGQIQVRRWADDTVVASGTLQAWNGGATHTQSGDRGWWFDFSAVTEPGSYYLFDTVNGVGSRRFDIGANVYAGVLRQALRTFFLQRLNQAKVAPYADARWSDAAAYERAGQDRSATSRWAKGQLATARDVHGGWMDAGDTNKYTTFAQNAVLQLLDAWRFNPAVFGDDLGIPESGNGLADLLDELRWELDFLGRMQDATGTGGLLLKVGADDYADVSPPSADTRPRYYLPECTSATLAGSAVFAAAAVVFRAVPSQVAYGDALLARAESAWNRAAVTTSSFSTFETACDDLDIKSGDADVPAAGQRQSALLAAVALYEATGRAEFRSFVEANHATVEPVSNNWWGPYQQPLQVALLRFAGMAGVTPSVASAIRNQKAAQNGVMSLGAYDAATDLYRAYLPDPQYHWGHNRVRSSVGNLNLDFPAFGVNGGDAARYREVAEQHLHWLHGANPLGLVMLSTMAAQGAERSLDQIYHGWFGDGTVWDSVTASPNGPAPGYLSGGPNRSYTGTVANITNQPPQKAYKDWNTGWPENSWELTEPSIDSQAAYVQLLARSMVAAGGGGGSDTTAPTAPSGLAVVAGSVTATGATLSWGASSDAVGVTGYDLYRGTALLSAGITTTSATVSTLFCATSSTFTVRARDAAGNTSAASNAATATTAACPTAKTVVYADAIGAGWADWSWGATRNWSNTTPVKVGSRSARFDLAAWGGLSLRRSTGVPLSSRAKLVFWVYPTTATRIRVWAQTGDTSGEGAATTVSLTAKRWTQVSVTRSALGNLNQVTRINVQLDSATPATLYVDQIELTV